MSKAYRSQLVRDAVRRFRHLPTQTLARYLLNNHGELWEGDLQKVRNSVRFFRGKKGKADRVRAADHSLFTETIQLPTTWRKNIPDFNLTPGLWLILGDTHIPFHEPKPIESAIDCGQVEKVDGVLLNGDIQDCSALSYWKKQRRDFDREMELVIDFLDYLRGKFPNQEIIYKPGNHEERLPIYYMTHAPEVGTSPISCMETLLGFEARGIEFLDYNQKIQAGHLPILHGHEVPGLSRAVNPAKGLFNRTLDTAACSHCHSRSEHSATNINGDDIATWSMGCLSDLHPDWNPFCNQWNWGFGLLELDKDKTFYFDNKKILKDGKVR